MPLLSVIEDAATRAELRAIARRYHQELVTDRSMETEAQVLEIVDELATAPDEPRVTVKDVTARFSERHAEDYERKVTTKWIGSIIRRRLGLKAVKSQGTFVIPVPELTKLARLREKYGFGEGAASETAQAEPQGVG